MENINIEQFKKIFCGDTSYVFITPKTSKEYRVFKTVHCPFGVIFSTGDDRIVVSSIDKIMINDICDRIHFCCENYFTGQQNTYEFQIKKIF